MFDEFGNWVPSGGGFALPSYSGWGTNTNAVSIPGMTPSVAQPVLNSPATYMGSAPMYTPDTAINSPAAVAGMPAQAKPGSIWDSFFNKTENGVTQQGWGGMALGAGSAIMNGLLGFQQLGVAKDTLAQNKRQFDINFAAQQKTTNARLADRQAARVAYGAGATSVSDYMKQYGI